MYFYYKQQIFNNLSYINKFNCEIVKFLSKSDININCLFNKIDVILLIIIKIINCFKLKDFKIKFRFSGSISEITSCLKINNNSLNIITENLSQIEYNPNKNKMVIICFKFDFTYVRNKGQHFCFLSFRDKNSYLPAYFGLI